MSWGMVAGAASGVVGGLLGAKGSKDAMNAELKGVREGIESEERMFDKSLELQAPYREAGYEALNNMTGMQGTENRANMLNEYYAGEEFGVMEGQVAEQQQRNALATGSGRAGSNKAAMATIAPSLGQDYLNNMYNQYNNVANMGMGAASQGSNQAMQLGGNVSRLQQSGAQARSANAINQANIWGNVVNDAGGFAMDYLNNKG